MIPELNTTEITTYAACCRFCQETEQTSVPPCEHVRICAILWDCNLCCYVSVVILFSDTCIRNKIQSTMPWRHKCYGVIRYNKHATLFGNLVCIENPDRTYASYCAINIFILESFIYKLFKLQLLLLQLVLLPLYYHFVWQTYLYPSSPFCALLDKSKSYLLKINYKC